MSGDAIELGAPVGELLRRVRGDLKTVFAQGHEEIFVGRAPGRLDLIGAMADYTGGMACELALQEAAAVAVQRRDDRRLVIRNYSAAGGAVETVEMSLDDFYGTAALVPEAAMRDLFAGERQWAAGVAGAYPMLARHKNFTRRTMGANIGCYSTVPTGGGAGSTSAMACATLSALTAAYHLLLEPLETAILAQGIQHHVVGIPGGVSDAVASELGKKDEIVLFAGQTHDVSGYLHVPAGFAFVGIHTGLAGNEWMDGVLRLKSSTAMAQAMIARMYKDLGFKKDPTGGCLAKISPDHFARYFGPVLPAEIEGRKFAAAWDSGADRAAAIDPGERYFPRGAAGYHVGENQRAVRFAEQVRAIAAAQDARQREVAAAAAGAAMRESHGAAAELAGLKSPRADRMIELLGGIGAGIYGARANAGTLAVLAADTAEVRAGIERAGVEFTERTGVEARVLWGSSGGCAEAAAVRLKLAEVSGGKFE